MQLVKLLWIVELVSLYGVFAHPVMIGGKNSGGRVAHSLSDDFKLNSEDMKEGFCMPNKVGNAGKLKPDNIECGSYQPMWTMSQLTGRKSLGIVLPKDQQAMLE